MYSVHFFQRGNNINIMIALRDNVTSQPETVMTSTTYWYNNATSYNIQLAASKTWAYQKYYNTDPRTQLAPRCFLFDGYDYDCNTGWTSVFAILCQLTSEIHLTLQQKKSYFR